MRVKKCSEILKDARVKKGLTQLQVANLLGLKGSQFVHLVEKEHSKIPRSYAVKWAEACGLKGKEFGLKLVAEIMDEVEKEIFRGRK